MVSVHIDLFSPKMQLPHIYLYFLFLEPYQEMVTILENHPVDDIINHSIWVTQLY